MHRREADSESGWELNKYPDLLIHQTEAKDNIHNKRVSLIVIKLTCHHSYIDAVRVNTLTISKTTNETLGSVLLLYGYSYTVLLEYCKYIANMLSYPAQYCTFLKQ